jgi:hypothetical protein
MAHWPSIIMEDMWPFAIRHLVNFHNASILHDKAASPHQLFTGEDAPWSLNDFRVFGCPAYVLAKQLQMAIVTVNGMLAAGKVYTLDTPPVMRVTYH